MAGDLALDHRLLDRARYIRELADHLDRDTVVALADDLVTAHEETVSWIGDVLAQEASGGPAALAPTPVQRVTGGVTRLVGLPARFTVERINRVIDLVVARGEAAQAQVRETRQAAAAKAEQIGADVRDIATAGRDAALARTEQLAASQGADRTAAATHEARAELGSLAANELPIPHYEELTAAESSATIRGLAAADDVRAVAAFEQTHKNRSTVLTAAQARTDELTRLD